MKNPVKGIENMTKTNLNGKNGKLILIATPIGNLGDISPRAVENLSAADLVAAEDTRHSGQLLNHLGIKKPMVSYYQHNEEMREAQLLQALEDGKDIAVISDAGTPGISDPGSAILKAAVSAGYEVDAIPGACAMVQALVLSGLPTEKFVFEGFLPRGSKLKPYLETLKSEHRTMVFYEAPHRLRETLDGLKTIFGDDRQIAVCRELTKKFQDIDRGTLLEICDLWTTKEVRGEFVLVVHGAEIVSGEVDLVEVEAHLARLMDGGMKHKAAAKEIAKIYDQSVSDIYEMGLKIKQ